MAKRAIVAGAGLNGLATAWHLLRLGCRPVTVLERFGTGHDRGSSHGPCRIIRSAYSSDVYVHLLEEANREDWPRLERDAGKPLIKRQPGCFFGPPGGLFQAHTETMSRFDFVTLLSPAEAARKFPQFRFEGMAGALDDETAGIVLAAETMQSLARLVREGGGEIRENTPVTRIEIESDPLRIHTPDGVLETDVAVVAAGAWTGELFPELRTRLTPVRQNVAYFPLQGEVLEQFPVWAYLGADHNDFFYGLPDTSGSLKLARHVTSDTADDPNQTAAPRPEAVEELEQFLERHCTLPMGKPLRAETCFYTNTDDEDFILDLHPGNPHLVIGAGFSGHGFKFGPVTGRILAELAVEGGARVAAFARNRRVFSLNDR